MKNLVFISAALLVMVLGATAQAGSLYSTEIRTYGEEFSREFFPAVGFVSDDQAMGYVQDRVNHKAVDYCERHPESQNFTIFYEVKNLPQRSRLVGRAYVDWQCIDGWPYYR